VQGHDNLNIELVLRGCFAPETQMLNPDETPEVPQKDYESFLQTIAKSGGSAKKDRLGIWMAGDK
jgi:hypothetical protein